MASPFYKVRCKDCGNHQIVFSKASMVVNCQICGAVLAEPTGGKAKIKGEIVEELSHAERTT
ncbi:MAG: 30S ribosomal protein S27e [Thermoplasmata archaeon]|nr:30S ribosomal protein S27e [Thermoplasmata archaeon]